MLEQIEKYRRAERLLEGAEVFLRDAQFPPKVHLRVERILRLLEIAHGELSRDIDEHVLAQGVQTHQR